jgi:RecA-family ATPase
MDDQQRKEYEELKRRHAGNGNGHDPAPPLDYIVASSRAGTARPIRPWLVEHWIPRRQVTLIGGMGGIGKTLLVLLLMIACATRGKWLGLSVMRCRAWGLFAEDEDDEIDLRLRDNAELADLADLAWRSEVVDPCELVDIGGDGRLRETEYFDRLRFAVRQFGARLVVLDAAANLFGGDELRRRQVAYFIRLLRALAIEIDGAVVLLAHPSNHGITSGSGISGSTAWWNSVRSLLVFEPAAKNGDEDGDKNDRVLRREKANYAARKEVIRLRWCDGAFVALDPPSGIDQAAMAAKADRIFKALLSESFKLGDKLSPNPSAAKTYAPRVFAKHPDREGVDERAFAGAMLRLRRVGEIGVKEDGPPSKRRSWLVLR